MIEQTGLDLDSRHPALRDATWSVAVQHGGAVGILIDAAKAVEGLATPDDCTAYDRALLETIYAKRTAYVLRVADRANAAAARTLRSITRNRYPAELEAAKAMLDG